MHRAGLRGNADDDSIYGIFKKRAIGGHGWQAAPKAVLSEYLLKDRLARHPGGRYSYSNTGYEILTAIIEEQTGIPYLIEMNGRATQTCHLNLGPGRNPVDALAHATAGNFGVESPKMTDSDTIALFPQEWKRDPASKFLQTAFHDVPWEYPGLVRFCVKKHLHELKWLSYERWVSFWSRYKRRRRGPSQL